MLRPEAQTSMNAAVRAPSRSFAEWERRLTRANVPQRALLELTHGCNFRCVHCYESNHNRRDELDTTQWKQVIDRLRHAGVLYLTFSGGEFLLRRDHAELARHAKANGFILRFFTNAAPVNDEVIRFWRDEIKPAFVEVSLYGASPTTYRAVCGSEKMYAQAMAGVERLAAAGFNLEFKIIALRQNVDEMADIVAIPRRLGRPYKVTGKLTPRDDGGHEPLDHVVPDSRWDAYAAEFETVACGQSLDLDKSPCGAGRTGFAVGPNGDVYPCVDMRRAVGNLVERELDEFWHDAPLLREVRAVRVRDFIWPERMNFMRARPPCMAHNLITTGSLVQIGKPSV